MKALLVFGCLVLAGCGGPSEEMAQLCVSNLSPLVRDAGAGQVSFPNLSELFSGDRRVSFPVRIGEGKGFNRQAVCSLSHERGVDIKYQVIFFRKILEKF